MPNINLVGPAQGQPLDIQTAQLKIAQQQALAQALTEQGLTPGDPTIHTGGSNPFARDVVNFGSPLGKLAQAYFGSKGLDEAHDAQQGLAQDYNKRNHEEVAALIDSMQMRDIPAVPSDEGPNPPTQGSNIDAGLVRAISSGMPGPVKIAEDILSKRTKAMESQVVSGDSIASMLSRGQIEPKSITEAMRQGPMGQVLDASKVRVNPLQHVLPGGVVVAGGRNDALAPGLMRLGQERPEPQPITQAGAAGGLAGAPTTVSEAGVPEVLKGFNETPMAKVQGDVGKDTTEELKKGYEAAQNFQRSAPAMVQMIELTRNADLGGAGAPLLTKARQLAVQLGVSHDDAGKIVDTQSLLKMTLPRVIESVHSVSARPSQLEFTGIQNQLAGNQEVDPRAAENVFKSYLTEGLNRLENHNQNIERAGKMGFVTPELASTYQAPSDADHILHNSFQGRKVPFSFARDQAGTWTDSGLGSQESHVPVTQRPGTPKKVVHWNDLP